MNIIIVIFACIISIFGTVVGTLIGIAKRKPSKKILGSTLGFASGLMLAVISFDLIPEAIEWNFFLSLILILIGAVILIVVDYSITEVNDYKFNLHKKVAFLLSIGIMLHNIPEGIIMGVGFFSGDPLGFKMAIIIAVHDIPEGIAFAAPLMVTNVPRKKIMIYSFITALPTLIGAVLGMVIESVSKDILGGCISIASGVMLYVVCCEMIPEASKLYNGKIKNLAIIFGFLIGMVVNIIL